MVGSSVVGYEEGLKDGPPVGEDETGAREGESLVGETDGTFVGKVDVGTFDGLAVGLSDGTVEEGLRDGEFVMHDIPSEANSADPCGTPKQSSSGR